MYKAVDEEDVIPVFMSMNKREKMLFQWNFIKFLICSEDGTFHVKLKPEENLNGQVRGTVLMLEKKNLPFETAIILLYGF